ncbi:PolC-type DNA polymerase III [uncultured Acetatifactor sp.]|uniref:PolC-type DNA polymerase III n=1 Tax=uncultured Acetatifactor sp. TaxID=1671927 RepID=UPI00262E647A|nr:PolC-type DNA polymerase III [uncultured Acetatifactor sp.]
MTKAKPFFEVFPSLELKGTLHDKLEQTAVERVSATKQKDRLSVYLFSTRLLPKEDIWAAEKAIKSQLFPHAFLTVRIFERFELSAQYTPENLMEAYRESILAELKEYSHVEYNAFRTAQITYPESGRIRLTIDDTVLNHSKEPELIRVLEKILVERCGLTAGVEVGYREAESGRFAEDDELRLQMKVNEIFLRAKACGAYGEGQSGQTAPGGGSANGRGGPGGDRRGAKGDVKSGGFPAGGAAKGNGFVPGERSGDGGNGFGGRADAPGDGSGNGKKAFRGDFKRGDFRRGDRPLKQSDNPDVIYGKDFEEEPIPIDEIIGEVGDVTIRGKVLKTDSREIRNERTIVIFDVTDFTDTMTVKLFTKTEFVKELLGSLKPGTFVKLKGVATLDKFDHELTIGSLTGIKKIPNFVKVRSDTAAHKRVELHCHTKMSDFDGVSEAKDIVKRAYGWGHRAIAITDHGVVQGFTDAYHVWEDLWKAEKGKCKDQGKEPPDKQDFFKVIYGVEAYLVDDLKEIVTGDKGGTLEDDFVVFDIETTGFSPVNNRIIEIGAVKVCGGQVTERFSTFVNPQVPIPFEIEKLTGIRDDMVTDAPLIEEVLPRFLEFCRGAILVAHNAGFDMSFMLENARRQGLPMEHPYIDTVGIARVLLPNQAKHTLDAVAKTLNISLENHHRAVDDAECTAWIFVKLIQMLEEKDIHTLAQLNALGAASADLVKKAPTYHAIILAKNDLGRINLYRLVTESHLTYYASRHPRIPKSLIQKYREGLILGSACEAGELYRALLDGQSDMQIARIVNFYDYLEIQPTGNNKFMIKSERIRNVDSMEDIQEMNRRVVKLGEQFHKPVVGTCDVHFLDPEDEVYRRIIMAGRGFEDADEQAPLFLHTTEEMLEEFDYLGSDKAYEVVVKNTNMIADMVEQIAPVRPDKCAPVIEDSDKTLTKICYDKAHEIYGPELPEIVEARLKKELHSIITNGFAVMYIIAQKLVWKSVEDGYLVGSRGSVGSSFVATMAGITEINPLSPHYYCTKCHYVDFEEEDVKAYGGKAGVDMPDKNCPVCGEPLHKDGFDIPFETFLGFKGDKEPDIDLNFSGEYQSKAHKYTEVIFGAGQTFRAGTIATLADKTAFGYVKNYFEERNRHRRKSEMERLAMGVAGVRRSTGQHPGGIVVLPFGQDINSFTPVQHPANDMETDIVTTHFDYHSIDHNLLKLDILGHDDPTMIRMLQDLTGVDPLTIPLDGQEVMSLFQNTDALGITPDQIGGTKLGILGIPEFGTDFAMQMVIDAQPKAFSDLVRISGLSHGTDVWVGNAKDLIMSGTATISTAICTRDDIMIYLIQMGVESSLAFTIMESVRKGKGLKDDWIAAMKEKDVPDWYIASCKKIKYMFPKAHAAAYVMMAWRIAYCKVHYPLAYYGAYFSIRAKAFSYELMCLGKARLEANMADYKRRMDAAADKEPGAVPLTNREEGAYGDMRIVQEMYERGYEFMPIDIFTAQSRSFQIVDGKLMPSLNSIEGLGDKAADAIVEAVKDGPFLSKDDFRERTKVSKTMVDLMDSLNLLGSLPESNQLSLFDL